MKIIKYLKNITIFGVIFFTSSAFSFEVGGPREFCKPAKFGAFSPPRRVHGQPFQEVEPGSEVSFTTWGSIEPAYIMVFAKKQLIKPRIVNRRTFFHVSFNLPAEFNGTFVRIDMIAKAEKEECKGKDGWLIKVKKTTEPTTEATEPETKETVSAEQSDSTE